MYDAKTIPIDRKESQDDHFALGRHVTIEFCRCKHDTLNDRKYLENVFIMAAERSGATVVSSSFHQFNPQGISGVVIIAESHFTVHSWPEHDYAAVDIFTCGDSIDIDLAVTSIKESLKSKNVIISADMKRGITTSGNFPEFTGDLNSRQNYPASWEKEFTKVAPWALQVSIDVHQCDPNIIRSKDNIQEFLTELCHKMDLKKIGKCSIVSTGNAKKKTGFNVTQHLTKSSISIHFANHNNRAYLDFFSSKFIEPRDLAELTISFFKGSSYVLHLNMRK